jgi:sugar lactone lactonase YvrE
MVNDDANRDSNASVSGDVEVIAEYGCRIGEGPLWHPDEERLYWVDIANGRLYRYDPTTDSHEQCGEGRPIGGYTIEADGALLLFRDRGTVTRWAAGQTRTLIEALPAEHDTRFNDVIADPVGRVFAGTMPTADHLGRLYRFDPDGSYTVVDDGLDLPNGMGFTPDREAFYLAVSDEYQVYRYDYDASTGAIANRTTFLNMDGPAVPDGLTVDTEGCIWVARWNGNRVERYAPDGELVADITVPVERPSSVTFGGTDYADLYITSARGEESETYRERAGALFRTRPGATGQQECRSRIAVSE